MRFITFGLQKRSLKSSSTAWVYGLKLNSSILCDRRSWVSRGWHWPEKLKYLHRSFLCNQVQIWSQIAVNSGLLLTRGRKWFHQQRTLWACSTTSNGIGLCNEEDINSSTYLGYILFSNKKTEKSSRRSTESVCHSSVCWSPGRWRKHILSCHLETICWRLFVLNQSAALRVFLLREPLKTVPGVIGTSRCMGLFSRFTITVTLQY